MAFLVVNIKFSQPLHNATLGHGLTELQNIISVIGARASKGIIALDVPGVHGTLAETVAMRSFLSGHSRMFVIH